MCMWREVVGEGGVGGWTFFYQAKSFLTISDQSGLVGVILHHLTGMDTVTVWDTVVR